MDDTACSLPRRPPMSTAGRADGRGENSAHRLDRGHRERVSRLAAVVLRGERKAVRRNYPNSQGAESWLLAKTPYCEAGGILFYNGPRRTDHGIQSGCGFFG